MGILSGYPFDWNGHTVTPGGILQGLVAAPIAMQVPTTGGFAPTASVRNPRDATPPPIGQTQPPPGSAPISAPRGPAPPAPMAGNGIGRAADQQNPFTSLLGGIGNAFSGGIAGLVGQGAAPGLLDRLSAGATNLTTGGNPLAGLLNAVNGLATGQRTDRAGLELAKQQATMSALINAGLDFETARAAAVNPDFLKALVVQRYGARPMGGKTAPPPRAGGAQDDRQEPAAVDHRGADRSVAQTPGKPQS